MSYHKNLVVLNKNNAPLPAAAIFKVEKGQIVANYPDGE